MKVLWMLKRTPIPEPPGDLSQESRVLYREWADQQTEKREMLGWGPMPVGHIELAIQALRSRDRAEQARREVEEHGVVFKSASGMIRGNPAVKVEKDSRALFCRIWATLER